MPKRIQLNRSRGWKMPPNAVKVDRSTRYAGNPFTVDGCREAGFQGTDREIAIRCVEAFRAWLTHRHWRENWDGEESESRRAKLLALLPTFRGTDLACWCGLCELHKDGLPLGVKCDECAPCHADVLLEIANGERKST